jgi:hypothetical protein
VSPTSRCRLKKNYSSYVGPRRRSFFRLLQLPQKILAPIVEAVAVRVVDLLPARTEVFVHVNFRTINPWSRVRRPLSIPICAPVMSPYSGKIFSGYQAFENRPVLTLQEDNGHTTAKFESVWILPFGRTTMTMNESERLTHYMPVSPIAFRHNLRLLTAPHMHRPEGFGPTCLSFRKRTTAVYHCALEQLRTCRPTTTLVAANGNFEPTNKSGTRVVVDSGRGPRSILFWWVALHSEAPLG